LIQNHENVGFGRACNQAISASSAPFVFILNPDTEVQEQSIDILLDLLKSDRAVGAAAPRLMNEDGTVQPSVWAHEIPYSLYVLLDGLALYRLLPRGLRAKLLRGRHWDHSERIEVRSFSGAAIMARREMIDQIGAFDERFDMYGEDAEWCSRMVRGGWKLIFEPAAQVIHHGGQSAAKRWTITEQRLREEEANLRYQRQSLSRFHFTLNTLSSAFVLTVLRVRAKLRHRSVEYLDAVLALKLSYLRRSWREREG
jgi:GT2 family glycosyltransferase